MPATQQARLPGGAFERSQREETAFWGYVGTGFEKGAMHSGLSSNKASLAEGGIASSEWIWPPSARS